MIASITKAAEHDGKSILFAQRNFSAARTSVCISKSDGLCFGILIWIACLCPAWSAPSVTHDDLTAQREQLQSKLETNKELLQKDIEAGNLRWEALGKLLDDQVTRVSDIGNAVDRFGVIVAILGTLITALLTAAGLVGYFSAGAKARREAAAESKKWFIENAEKLTGEIEELQRRAAEASQKIDSHLLIVANKKAAAIAEIEEQQASMNKTPSDVTSPEKEYQATPAIQFFAEELRKQPESSYSFDDWNVRAFAAHGSGKLDDAAHFWGKAAEVPAAGAVNTAQAIHNKGVMLEQLQRYEEAVSAYDELIAKYGQDPVPALRELVVKAMHNRGVMLSRLDRHEEAIAAHDALITNYGQDPAPALRELVAKAMQSKGVVLGQLDRHEAAITAYDALITNYGQDPVPALRELVAKAMHNKGVMLSGLERYEEAIALSDALIAQYSTDTTTALLEQVARTKNGKGFTLLCRAKSLWKDSEQRKKLLTEAMGLFDLVLVTLPESAMVVGNQAYCAWLQGNHAGAEEKFAAALAKPDGGKHIFEATLNDLEIHPVEEDAGFKALIEKLWSNRVGSTAAA